jgi:Na+(H+)/acetate symporter ActP
MSQARAFPWMGGSGRLQILEESSAPPVATPTRAPLGKWANRLAAAGAMAVIVAILYGFLLFVDSLSFAG